MSIKSDRWIRRMAEEEGMIDPFEPGQVRSKDGNRLISYGTSSYGYDVQALLARYWRVFTNINSATWLIPGISMSDSFVDIESDVCVIPPIHSPWPQRWNISEFRATC